MSTIEAFEQSAESTDQRAETDYRQAVLETAEGNRPHADDLRAILYEAGRSREEFERHLDTARRRHQATEDIAECTALERQISEIDASRKEIEAALNRLRDDYRAAVSEPLARSTQLQQQRLAARRRMSTLKARALAELRATRPAAWETRQVDLSRLAESLRTQNGSDGRQIARLTPDSRRVATLEANLLSHQNGTGTLTRAEQQELDAAHRALEQIDSLQDAILQRNEQLTEVEQAIDEHQTSLLDWRNIDF